MAKIILEGFAGEIPKVQPRQLPPTHAAQVTAARLTRGDLAPMRGDLALTTLAVASVSFYLHGSTWLSWPAEAEAAPGPVATDRLYVTRSDAAPQILDDGVTMNLALQAPSGGCSAAYEAAEIAFPIAASGGAHRFTFTDGKWVRSSVSIPVTLSRVRATAIVGQSVLFDTDHSVRRIVAVLPLAPTSGDAMVISNRGQGYLTAHRNGSTIAGVSGDLTYQPGDRNELYYYASGAWQRKNIGAVNVALDDGSNTATAYSAFNGDNIQATDEKGTIKINLPAGSAVGQSVYVRRNGPAKVELKASGAQTIEGGGTYLIAAKGDRVAVVWNGTQWKVIRFEGEFGEDFYQTAVSMTVEKFTAVRFLSGVADKAVLADMPTATTGQTCNIGVVGRNNVILLPSGLLLDGENGPLEMVPGASLTKLTKTAAGWSVGNVDMSVTKTGMTPEAGDQVIAYSKTARVDITMPSGGANGDVIDIVRIGPKAVRILNMASQDLAEATVYVYTWVTSRSEESMPSAPSNTVYLSPGRDIVVTMPAAAPVGRGVTHRRIYRSVTSASGITDFYFVGQVAVATTTFTDSTDRQIAEVLPSADFDPPLSTLRGITAMPNGMMAAFSGREVYFCEPYIPHAWPSKYALTVGAPIVGLAALGTSLVVLTTAQPWIVQGIHPSAMSAQKIEADFPCLSMRGIVDMGYAAVYPSTDGLVQIGPDGSAALISSALWDREQWLALNPSTFRAAKFISRYAFSYDPAGLSRSLAFVDLSGELPFLIPVDGVSYRDLLHHVQTGRLIGLDGDGKAIRSIDDRAAGLRIATWRSKPFLMPSYDSFGVVKVDAYAPPAGVTPFFEFRAYADGVLLHTITQPNYIKRLPSKLADEWQFEIVTNWTVVRAQICGIPDELI